MRGKSYKFAASDRRQRPCLRRQDRRSSATVNVRLSLVRAATTKGPTLPQDQERSRRTRSKSSGNSQISKALGDGWHSCSTRTIYLSTTIVAIVGTFVWYDAHPSLTGIPKLPVIGCRTSGFLAFTQIPRRTNFRTVPVRILQKIAINK